MHAIMYIYIYTVAMLAQKGAQKGAQKEEKKKRRKGRSRKQRSKEEMDFSWCEEEPPITTVKIATQKKV